MITTDGGFARIVNVESSIEANEIKTIIKVKLFYGNETAKRVLISKLNHLDFYYLSQDDDDIRTKHFFINPLKIEEEEEEELFETFMPEFPI